MRNTGSPPHLAPCCYLWRSRLGLSEKTKKPHVSVFLKPKDFQTANAAHLISSSSIFFLYSLIERQSPAHLITGCSATWLAEHSSCCVFVIHVRRRTSWDARQISQVFPDKVKSNQMSLFCAARIYIIIPSNLQIFRLLMTRVRIRSLFEYNLYTRKLSLLSRLWNRLMRSLGLVLSYWPQATHSQSPLANDLSL